ncbi:MAG TPA: BamA/TamA family outer membrane protein [Bacteroidota bacterium]
MTKFFLHCTVPILLLHTPSVAQEGDSLSSPQDAYGIIDTVIIAGNLKTKDYVILDEMTLKPGMVATDEAIEYDRNRVYSLGLFTKVGIYYDVVDGMRFLFVDVGERWYLIPVPLFGFRDGDPKRPYYGGGILHSNFQGMNQKLFGSIVFGHNPAISLSFSDPLIDRENDLSLQADLSYSRVRSRSTLDAAITGAYDEIYYNASVGMGKRFSLEQSAGVSVGFRMVKVSEPTPGRTVSFDGIDRFPVVGLWYNYDSRDLREYPAQGYFASVYLWRNGFWGAAVDYSRWGFDTRSYILLPWDLTFAARIHGTQIFGEVVPVYGHTFFGYAERIRGHFKTVLEGENMIGGTIELRYPLLKARDIYFNAVELPPEFSVWRFGIGLALFADVGSTWFRGEPVALNSFLAGFGGGIRFLLPYSVVIRTEYGFDESWNGEFILDFRKTL